MFEQFYDNRKSRLDCPINAKSRHLIVMNQLKKKEDNWNNRFYVKNESVEKPHPQRINNYQKLIEVQDYHGIPEFHRQLFLLCLKTLPKINQAIQFEIEEMNQKKSHIQLCMQAVETREKCLSTLLQQIQFISENQDDQQLISKSAEYITHLRILSINVVESILGWRQYLMKFLVNVHSQESISLPYIYFRENYLIKMKKDSNYIQNSVLSQYYSFSNKSDPFFVSITKPDEDQTKIVQFISKPLLKRIKNCEIIIQEESTTYAKDDKSLHNQINSRDQIKLSPEKQVQPGRIRPPKRPEQSQNQKRQQQPIKQIDPTDFTYQTQNSLIKNNQQQQQNKILNKQGENTPIKQNSFKINNESSTKKQDQQQQQQQQQQQYETLEQQQQQQQQQQIKEQNINSQKISQQNSPKASPQIDLTPKIQKCQLNDQIVIDYLTLVNEEFKKSWKADPQHMKQQYEQQDDSFCLGIFINNELIAFAQCYTDSSLQDRKMILSHFSTKESIKFQEYLKQMIDHLWTIDSCTEVRMWLYHYNQNDTFQENKQISAKLKELGFRWKVVQSVNSEIRFTVMAIKRPIDTIQLKAVDQIFLQHLYFTSNNEIEQLNYFYSLSCLTNLSTKMQIDDQQINVLKNMLIQSEFQFKGLKCQEHEKQQFKQYLIDFFDEFENSFNQYLQIENLPTNIISSFCKECFRWSKSKLAKKDRIIYNSFKPEINPDNAKVFMATSQNQQIYIISTDQSNTSMFIMESIDEIDLQKVQSILSSINNQIPIDQILYLPQFIVNANVHYNNNIQGIGRFSTAYHPKYVDVPEIQEGVIIKTPFIFGVIHEDFNEICNMPNLFFKVDENACLQIQ